MGYVSTLLKGSIILKLFWILIIGVFIFIISFKKNKNEEALYLASYLVGAEVFFRMSGGIFLYETGKYGIILFSILGIFLWPMKQKRSILFLVYLL